MSTREKSVMWSIVLLLAIADATGAQSSSGQNSAANAMAQCNVDENTPSAVAKASIFWGDSYTASGDSLKAIALQHAGKALTDPMDHNMANQSGKAWEMGRIAVSWLAIDSQQVVTTRSQLGLLGGDPSQPVDLSMLLDSSFKVVETQLPKCLPIVMMYREGPGWIRLIQQALNQTQDAANLPPTDTANVRRTYDSALTSIQQARRVSPRSPYVGIVQGQVHEWKNDTKAAVADYQDAIQQTMRDTLYDPVRREIYEKLGKLTIDAVNAMDSANVRDSAARHSYLAVGKQTFTGLAQEPGTSGSLIAAQGLMAIAILSGDTASIEASYRATLNNPDASYQDLIAAGFAADHAVAAGLKDGVFDEIRLFRKAGEVNPWGRDWLFNLSIVLAKSDSGVAARSLIDRLMIVDPAGLQDYQAAQTIYAMVERGAVATANHYADLANAAKAPADAQRNRAYADSSKIWDDSAAFFATKSTAFLFQMDSVPVGVQVTGWIAKSDSVRMSGILTNVSPMARSGTMRVEFLDREGKVVSTAAVPVALDPKGSANATRSFMAVAAGTGILAFKYTMQY